MNVALVYRGFYKRKCNRWDNGGNNFSKYILDNNLDAINSLNCKSVHIYFDTYAVNKDSDTKMLNLFRNKNLIKFKFNKFTDHKITDSMLNSVKLIDNTYDLIINTRFDIIFLKPLSEFNISSTKFNFFCKDVEDFWERGKKTSDLLFIFSSKYSNTFIKLIEEQEFAFPSSRAHLLLYQNMIGNKYLNENDINFMIKGFFSSNTDIQRNKYLFIKRY